MTIFIENMKVRAHHGVFEQERVVGADFLVSLRVDANVADSALDDDRLDGTINYADLCDDIKTEMAVPSNLLEHVAARIARRVLCNHGAAQKVHVRVVKCNPPMGADLAGAGVEMDFYR